MAYATQAATQGLMAKFALSPSSTPTDAQATAIITSTSSEIDVVLATRGLTVPLTAPQYFVDYLADVNEWGAAAAILKSMFPGSTGPSETPAWAFWEKRYQDALKGLKDGSLIPADVVPTGNAVIAASTYLTNNPDTEVYLGVVAEPMFKIGKVF